MPVGAGEQGLEKPACGRGSEDGVHQAGGRRQGAGLHPPGSLGQGGRREAGLHPPGSLGQGGRREAGLHPPGSLGQGGRRGAGLHPPGPPASSPPHLSCHGLDVGGDHALEGVGVLLPRVDDGFHLLLPGELIFGNHICGRRGRSWGPLGSLGPTVPSGLCSAS